MQMIIKINKSYCFHVLIVIVIFLNIGCGKEEKPLDVVKGQLNEEKVKEAPVELKKDVEKHSESADTYLRKEMSISPKECMKRRCLIIIKQ